MGGKISSAETPGSGQRLTSAFSAAPSTLGSGSETVSSSGWMRAGSFSRSSASAASRAHEPVGIVQARWISVGDGLGVLDRAEQATASLRTSSSRVLRRRRPAASRRLGSPTRPERPHGADADSASLSLSRSSSDAVAGMAGDDVGIDGRDQIGAVQMQVKRNLRPLHLQDLGIGLDLLGQGVDRPRCRSAGILGAGADFRLAGAQGVDQDVVGVLVVLLAGEIGGFGGPAWFRGCCNRRGEGGARQQQAARKRQIMGAIIKRQLAVAAQGKVRCTGRGVILLTSRRRSIASRGTLPKWACPPAVPSAWPRSCARNSAPA